MLIEGKLGILEFGTSTGEGGGPMFSKGTSSIGGIDTGVVLSVEENNIGNRATLRSPKGEPFREFVFMRFGLIRVGEIRGERISAENLPC